MSRRSRLLVAAGLVLGMLVLLPCVLVYSSLGLRLALGVGETVLPGGQLRLASVQGSLADGVVFYGLHLDTADFTLEINRLAARLDAAALLRGDLHFTAVSAGEGTLALKADPSLARSRLPDLPGGSFAIRVDEATLSTLKLTFPAGGRTVLKRLRLAFDWPRGAPLQLADFSLSHGPLDLTMAGRWGERRADAFALELHWRQRVQAALVAQGSGTLTGEGTTLRFAQQVVTPIEASVNGQLELPLDAASWQLALRIPEGQTLPASAGLPPVRVAGELRATGNGLIAHVIEGDLILGNAKTGDWLLRLEASSVEPWQVVIHTLALHNAQETRLSLAGTLDLRREVAALTGRWNAVQWPLAGQAQWASPQGSLELSGSAEGFHWRLQGDATGGRVPALNLKAEGHGDHSGLVFESLALAGDGANAAFTGKLDWAPVLALDLRGQWQGLRYRQPGGPVIASQQGELAIAGDPDAWTLSSAFEASIGRGLPGHLSVRAQGGRSRLVLEAFEARAGKGRLSAVGQLDWAGNLPSWKVQASAQAFDPGAWFPSWPGQLDFTLDSVGGPADFTLELRALSGSLRGRKVSGEANVARRDGLVVVNALALHAGQADLRAHGALGRDGQVDWQLDIPDLADLWPTATGALKGEGTLAGSLERPASHGKLVASALDADGWMAHTAEARWDFDLRDTRDQKFALESSKLGAAGYMLDALRLDLEGPLSQLSITLDARRGLDSWSAALAGGLEIKPLRWQGQLISGQWRHADKPRMQLGAPAAVSLSQHDLSLATQCWELEGRLCLEASLLSDGSWQGLVSASALNLDALPHLVEWQRGQLSGTLAVGGKGSLLANANGSFDLSPGTFELADEDAPAIGHDGITLRLATQETGLALALAGRLNAPATVPASLSLTLPPGPWDLAHWRDLPLRGQVRMDAPDLAPWAVLSEEVAELAGSARVNLGLGGSLGLPEVTGEAAVNLSRVQLTRLGIELVDLDLTLKGGADHTLALDGRVRSGLGTAEAHGTVSLLHDVPSASLRIVSERLKVLDLPTASVLASARLKLEMQPERALLRGEITIPEAKISLQETGSQAVRSPDVLISDDDTAVPTRAMVLDSDITLRLGEKVNLDVMGLSGRLTGQLQLRDESRRATRARGELRIEEGHYTQWGQELTLKPSRVLFNDDPLTEPQVDARAERIVGEITAGVRMTGRLQDPRVRLYSSPAMSDADALSYLVAGRPLSGTSASDATALMGAATSLGFRQGSFLTQRIAHAFGLDEISVASNPLDKNLALSLGKYLSPRLYVGYGMGLFDQASTFRLRYSLNKHWNVEAETGSRSGADLLYTIEK